MIPADLRIRKNRDFRRIYKNCQVKSSKHLRLLWARGAEGKTRVGFVVGKTTGSAVVRNRVKRLLRESWRKNLGLVETGYDAVVQVKRERGREMAEVFHGEIEKELLNLGRKAGIIRKKNNVFCESGHE